MSTPTESDFRASGLAELAIPELLEADWQIIMLSADAVLHPHDLPEVDGWKQAKAPGTAFEALYGRNIDLRGDLTPLHDYDIWYRTSVEVKRGEKLKFEGLAGLAEIWIDDRLAASTTSMFKYLMIDIVDSRNSIIAIRFRSLRRALEHTGSRPRWRTKLVSSNALRMYRQTLLGHMPGWCPGVHAVGLYRPIYHIRGRNVITTCSIQARMQQGSATLSVQLGFLLPPNLHLHLKVQISHYVVSMTRVDERNFNTQLILTDLEPWWPHTHGDPKLYDVTLSNEHSEVSLGKVGFREITVAKGAEGDEFQLKINGVPIFCRGACWTNADLVGLKSDRATYLKWLTLVKEAGMNMVRVGGTMLYESKHLHDLCDELGILVWQDLMFANLDYPVENSEFKDSVLVEVEQLLERTSSSPSLAVICGGSEIAQQAVMLGLSRDKWSISFFDALLSTTITASRSDVVYVANSPWGGDLPMSADAGVTHYYGVGAYERPLEDARRADVRFASECLAFANLPSIKTLTRESLLDSPQDPGTTWNFADTRDHYLKYLYNVDPSRLRSEDPSRYLISSQATTADLMELVFSEWRRPGSSCAGGLVWQLQDLVTGSGWGVIDSEGQPKSAWYGLRRVLASVQILVSDEGVNGLDIHVLNDKSITLMATVRLVCLNHLSMPILKSDRAITVEARSSMSVSSHTLIDGFFDITRSYRFGPSEHRVTVASLICSNSGRTLSQAFHFPIGRDLPIEDIGLDIQLIYKDDTWMLEIKTRLFAQAVRIDVDGYLPDDNWFHMAPTGERFIKLTSTAGSVCLPSGTVTALNSRKIYSVKAYHQ